MSRRDEALIWMLAIFAVAAIVGAAVWWNEHRPVAILWMEREGRIRD